MLGVIVHFGTDWCLSVPTSPENRPVSLNSTDQTTLFFSDALVGPIQNSSHDHLSIYRTVLFIVVLRNRISI